MKKRKKKKDVKEEVCDEESEGRPACFAPIWHYYMLCRVFFAFFQKINCYSEFNLASIIT